MRFYLEVYSLDYLISELDIQLMATDIHEFKRDRITFRNTCPILIIQTILQTFPSRQ